MKRLLIDIETSPNICLSWRTGYKIDLQPESIIQERAIICICYKWEGKPKIHSLKWNNGDDKQLLQEFAKVAAEADEIVGHNGDHFDLPWIRTRSLFHNIPLIQDIKSLDTFQTAKSKYYFNSNKLDYIAQYLGLGKKIATGGLQSWKDIMGGNTKALNRMVKYCQNDVLLLEKVFQKLKVQANCKTHVAVLQGGLRSDCPECASVNVNRHKIRPTRAGYVQIQLHCQDCSRYFSVPESVLKSDDFKREQLKLKLIKRLA